MTTPLPFGMPQALQPTVQSDAVENIKRHARNVLQLMEKPMSFSDDWHRDVQAAVAGQMLSMLQLLETTDLTLIIEGVTQPVAEA